MAKPKPFQRPSVDLDRNRKQWRDIYPEDLIEGDIVQDLGAVNEITINGAYTTVMFITGRVRNYGYDEKVFAFTSAQDRE